MEFNSELEARQEIMKRLDAVYDALDELIKIAINRNHKAADGIGYRLGINKNDFNEIKVNFDSFYNLRHVITKEHTTNYDDWHEMITMVYSLLSLFKESKILFMAIYETTSADIRYLKEKIKRFVNEKKLDPVKNSTQYKAITNQMSLKQRCEKVLNENDIYVGDDFHDLDFNGKQDFIVYSFISAKYEIAINGLNAEFAEFIKLHPGKISTLDDLEWMLEMMRDDGVITQEQFEQFEAYYEDVIVLVEDLEELKIISKNEELLSVNESDLKTTLFEMGTVGEVIDSRLEGMDFYYLVLTGTPAYHSGLILLDNEVSREEIIQKIALIQLEGFSVGFKFEDIEEYWDKGEQIKQKYVTANLFPAEKINGKNFNELFD